MYSTTRRLPWLIFLRHVLFAQPWWKTKDAIIQHSYPTICSSLSPSINSFLANRCAFCFVYLLREGLLFLTDLLKKNQRENTSNKSSSKCDVTSKCFKLALFVLVLVALVLLATGITINIPGVFINANRTLAQQKNSTATRNTLNTRQIISITALSVSAAAVTFVFLLIFCFRNLWLDLAANIKLLVVAAFAKLPIETSEQAILQGDEEGVKLELDKPPGIETRSDVGGKPSSTRWLFHARGGSRGAIGAIAPLKPIRK